LSWKRSASKAEFDICIDPIDDFGHVPSWCSFSRTAPQSQREKIGCAAFDAAHKDFLGVASMEDICTFFQSRSEMKFLRFSLSNYVQTELAWGLALLACGDEGEGQRHIAKFCDDFGVDPSTPALRKASTEARELSLLS
jgi:hypothetical protein